MFVSLPVSLKIFAVPIFDHKGEILLLDIQERMFAVTSAMILCYMHRINMLFNVTTHPHRQCATWRTATTK